MYLFTYGKKEFHWCKTSGISKSTGLGDVPVLLEDAAVAISPGED